MSGGWLSFVVLARRAVQEYIITAIKEVLRTHFNRAVELKVRPRAWESDIWHAFWVIQGVVGALGSAL